MELCSLYLICVDTPVTAQSSPSMVSLNRWQREHREVCTRRMVSQAWSPHGKASMVLFGLSFMLFFFFCLPCQQHLTLWWNTTGLQTENSLFSFHYAKSDSQTETHQRPQDDLHVVVTPCLFFFQTKWKVYAFLHRFEDPRPLDPLGVGSPQIGPKTHSRTQTPLWDCYN